MMFMNEMDIDDAVQRWQHHPVLGPATLTLSALRDAANANSDGWAYWPKPCRAAAKLQELIQGNDPRCRYDDEREDATPQALRAALAPIKAFRTKSGLKFDITEEERAATARTRRAALVQADLDAYDQGKRDGAADLAAGSVRAHSGGSSYWRGYWEVRSGK